MLYELKNCRDASPATYATSVELSEKDGILTFAFSCAHSSCFCPHENYNDIHSEGDAVEVLIGSDPARKEYYEIELAPNGQLMLALMVNHGDDENDEPILDINFVEDCFVTGKIETTKDGYKAILRVPKDKIRSGDGEIYFNCYRLDTDNGEERDRHLMAMIPTMRPKFHNPVSFGWLKDYFK